MKNILEYKGYSTRVEFSQEDNVLFGKVEGINDLILFESNKADEIEMNFHEAVDEYLDFCKNNKLEPNKSFKGSFNVRLDSDLHKKLVNKAFKEGVSLNAIVDKACRRYVETEKDVIVRHIIDNRSLKANSENVFSNEYDLYDYPVQKNYSKISYEN